MGVVLEGADGKVRLSIARIAAEFGMGRDTVARRIADAGVRPDGKRNGWPVYRLRDVCHALFGAVDAETGRVDPASLKPADRRAWYQSENERLKFEQETGNLILESEWRGQLSTVAKIVVRDLETLPDRAERDLRCGPEVVEFLQTEIRNLRAEIAKHMAADDEIDARISA